jgi:hypothetical protein
LTGRSRFEFPDTTPQRILHAIAEQFYVDIVSEREPEFWRRKTEEEWKRDWAAWG